MPTGNPDLIFVLLMAAFLVGAFMNLKRFRAYALVTLILITPFYATIFMPREVFGITGLNFWNVVWLAAVGFVFLPARECQPAVPGPPFLSWPLAVFVIALLLSTVYGMNADPAMPRPGSNDPTTPLAIFLQGWLKPMQFMVLGWLVYRHCLATRDVRPVARTVLVSAIIFGAMVLYLYWLGSTSGYVDPYGTYVIGRDAVSMLSGMHANDVGAWATYGLVFAVHWQERSRLWAYVRRAAIAMAILTVVFSFSRTAYVVAPLALLLLFKNISLKEKVAAMIVVAVVVVYTAPLLIERASFRMETKDLNEISALRIERIWKPLWSDVEESPIFGSGRFAQIRSKHFPMMRVSSAHSAYLQILLEMGAIGLLIVGLMLYRLYAVGAMSQSALPYLIFVCCMVGIMGHSFIPDASNFLMWVGYSMSLAMLALARTSLRETSAEISLLQRSSSSYAPRKRDPAYHAPGVWPRLRR